MPNITGHFNPTTIKEMDISVDNRLFTASSSWAAWNNSVQGAGTGSPLVTLNATGYDSRYNTPGSVYPLSLIFDYIIHA